MLSMICPACGSAETRKYSRAKYFIKMGLCALAVLFGYLCYTVIEELDAPANLGATFFIFGGVICAPLSINYFIRALLKKKSGYICRTCKKAFHDSFKTKKFSLNGGLLVSTIRKRG